MVLLPVERPTGAAPVRAAVVGPSRPPGRRVRWAVASAAPLLLVVLVVALAVGGARPEQVTAGLSDPGPVTRWGLPVAELLARLLAVLTVGRLLLAGVLVPSAPLSTPPTPPVPSAPVPSAPVSSSGRARTFPARGVVLAATGSAAAWLAAEVVLLVLTASSLYGVPVTDVSAQALLAVLTELPFGRSAVVVTVLLLGLVLGCALATRRSHARLLLVLALVAVVVPVVTAGHSASAADHVAAVTTLSVHVVAASLWVGGLAALLLHGRGRAWTAAAVRRFSALALGCVVVLALSGSLAAVLVAGSPSAVLGSGYGSLLLAKTGLLLVLAGLGWWHRRTTMPALAAGRPRAFVRLAAGEVLLLGGVIAVSVALAASPTPGPAAEPAPDTRAAPVSEGDGTTQGAGDQGAQAGGSAAGEPDTGADADSAAPAGGPAPVEDMSGHDHGELSVGVLVDDERFHVSSPVSPSQRVTVYNSSDVEATLTSLDGSFDAVVGARTFITFAAPAEPGTYAFVSSLDPGFADVLQVVQD